MSYKAGIIAAITELKDRSGSSSIAIKKHMQANMSSDKKWLNATFLKALKTMVAAGDLNQTKNSYKLRWGQSTGFTGFSPLNNCTILQRRLQEEGCQGCCPEEEGCSQEEGSSQEEDRSKEEEICPEEEIWEEVRELEINIVLFFARC